MKVAVYFTKNNQEHDRVLAAFAQGVLESQDELIQCSLSEEHELVGDVAVVFGVYKLSVPISSQRGAVIELYKNAGRRVLILEKGYLRREHYYAAGWNDLNGRADFMNQDSPSDRFNELRLELRPYQNRPDGPVVVMGQVPWDASVQHTEHFAWLAEVCNELLLQNIPVIVRPHPLALAATPWIMGTERSEGPLADVLQEARAVVTFNSNTGVDALLAGIPTFSFDRGSMVWEVSSSDLAQLNDPTLYSREQWADNLAYAQWSLSEMSSGLTWAHLRPGALP